MASKYSSLSLSSPYFFFFFSFNPSAGRLTHESPKLATQPGEVKQTEGLCRPASGWMDNTHKLARIHMLVIHEIPSPSHRYTPNVAHRRKSQQCAFFFFLKGRLSYQIKCQGRLSSQPLSVHSAHSSPASQPPDGLCMSVKRTH